MTQISGRRTLGWGLWLALLGLAPLPLRAQTATSLPPPAGATADTTRTVRLPAATVTGYGQQLPLRRTAAGIGLLETAALERFSQTSITQAVNTLPGVRLEERAPASYRLSIRGSTLRSPFGVRNVKVYYFDIPFTEPGGTTPLNLLDPAQLGRIEVLKGPAGSVYGAGTGGVVRLENRRPQPGQSGGQVGFTAGSYGLRRLSAVAETGGASAASPNYLRVQYARQTSDGYRQNSALRRDVLALDAETAPAENQTLAVHALYTDLDYQLPGGLTRAQFEADPRQARPATRTSPGTVEQRAYYASQTALLGLTHEYRFTERWTSRATLYGTGTRIRTPYLVDFERNTSVGGGGRASLSYRAPLAGRLLRLTAGGEAQAAFLSGRSYQNLAGTPGPLRYDDEITTRTGFGFAQADYELPAGLQLTAGASYNRLTYRINRLSDNTGPATAPARSGYQIRRDFRPEISPRVALLKEITDQLSAYVSVSSGFSPPSEAEIRPSDGSINQALQAERGLSYEVGSRGALLAGRLSYDVALFDFELKNTIVVRSNDQGTQLFANAGTTRQRGAEAALSGWLWRPAALAADAASNSLPPSPTASRPAAGLRAWASYAYNHFRFGRYESLGQDYSGNRLTGTTPHTLSAGLDFSELHGFYANPNLSHQARLPLNDANSDYAAGYWTFSARAGWRRALPGGFNVDVFGGVDNALDRRYSLGNDLNAFGGRYFQPAPARSWYGGALLGWRWR
ncbi:TonB-dependent receptor [uncultured Hymenobacter sp.]|uniref:TonB-dependent receptor n=1 Tax=uncultured Hymenobacter sp. TaxID=170016 RepID=UPI0035CC7840